MLHVHRWNSWTWLCRSTGCRDTTGYYVWKYWNTCRLSSRRLFFTTSTVLPVMVLCLAGLYQVRAVSTILTTDLRHTPTRPCSTGDWKWMSAFLVPWGQKHHIIGSGVMSTFIFDRDFVCWYIPPTAWHQCKAHCISPVCMSHCPSVTLPCTVFESVKRTTCFNEHWTLCYPVHSTAACREHYRTEISTDFP